MELTKSEVEEIPISEIVVGKRRRQKLGDIRGLTRSIKAHGLIHPIIVRNGKELVVGERRLNACKRLGWSKIPARRAENMTDEELRAVELDENLERLALADFEASKQRLAQIRQAEAELKLEADAQLFTSPVNNSKRGRPKENDSKRAVAEKTGISDTSQRRIEDHIALAVQFPFMQKNGWVQYQVLHAGEELKKIPEKEYPHLAVILDQPAIPPKKSIEIIENLSEMTETERKAIYELAESTSSHEQNIALAMAARVPVPADPALKRIRDAKSALVKAADVCITEPFIDSVRQARDAVINLEQDFTRHVRGGINHGNTRAARNGESVSEVQG